MKLSKKILLIGRDWQPGCPLRDRLILAGYTVREASDTALTLRIARWFQPDLVLINLSRTGREGEILTEQLQTNSELDAAPLLWLTNGRSSGEFVTKGILSGYSFLAGPVGVDALLRGIARLFADC